jgi:CBS domain-containing protein
VRISDLMTGDVVTATCDTPIVDVARLMRDREVGSVVVCDGDRPVALITDRDIALLVAGEVATGDVVKGHASEPLVSGHIDMDVEEAAARMVQNRVRRLPILDTDGGLAGIVTLDDLAIRTGDPELAQRLTAQVARAALPDYFFHQRGG